MVLLQNMTLSFCRVHQMKLKPRCNNNQTSASARIAKYILICGELSQLKAH